MNRRRSVIYGPTALELAEQRRQEQEHALQQLCARNHADHWVVLQREGNASAFNGYHWTRSDYSACRCEFPGCGRVWRTKANYVRDLPDAQDSPA